MDLGTSLLALAIFTSWGLSCFVAKLAAERIGGQSTFWDMLGVALAIFLYTLFILKFKNIFSQFREDKIGVSLAFLSGLITAIGSVSFYFLITRKEASAVVPLTALYPALTVVLAIIFLHESITVAKIFGVIFSLIAIYLLSK